MGYFRGVIHGMAVGTVVGLCVAPQEGARTRAQLQRAVGQTRTGIQRAQVTARAVVPMAQSAVRTVAGAAGSLRHGQEEAEPYVSVNGSGNGSATVRHE
jgi:gas vesicle protein